MSMNAFTLNNLYNQGILDYVPFELCNGANISAMNGMQNPYLNSAKQGALYQNHGQYGDTVEFGVKGVNRGVGVNNFGLESIGSQGVNELGINNIGSQSNAGGVNGFGLETLGSQSNAGGNAFGLEGIGSQSNAGGANAYGVNGIGSQSNAGLNSFGIEGIGANSPSAAQAWGGFGDVRNNFQKTVSTVDSMPKFLKGIIAGALMVGSAALVLRRGKKPPVQKKSFFAKLNPFKK